MAHLESLYFNFKIPYACLSIKVNQIKNQLNKRDREISKGTITKEIIYPLIQNNHSTNI